jgi:hypothetical protein
VWMHRQRRPVAGGGGTGGRARGFAGQGSRMRMQFRGQTSLQPRRPCARVTREMGPAPVGLRGPPHPAFPDTNGPPSCGG